MKVWLEILFFQILRPKLWTALAQNVMRAIRTRWRQKIHGNYHSSWYPPAILKCYLELPPISASTSLEVADWNFLNFVLLENNDENRTINLAGHKISTSELESLWKKNNLEVEILSASHRFHWLLEVLATGISQTEISQYAELVDKWMQANMQDRVGEAWQPYAVSERICNLIVFKIAARNYLIVEHWDVMILEHLNFLADHLEYPASGIINNHLLNNARALYIGGKYFQQNAYAKLGREIIRLHLPQMLGGGGYLLEASVHYQFLLTRSMLEVFIIAKHSMDLEFTHWLEHSCQKMLSASVRLLPVDLRHLGDLPHIGDVSPDINVDWFDPRPLGQQGWQKIWGAIADNGPSRTVANDGWEIVHQGSWFGITYIHPAKSGYPVGHGHEDFGSPCVYFKGHPLIVDVGRKNYQSSANRHSIPSINQCSIIYSGRGVAAPLSAASRAKADAGVLPDYSGFFWVCNGSQNNIWKRELAFKADSMMLTDLLNVGGCIEGTLYFDPNVNVQKVSDHDFQLSVHNFNFKGEIEGVQEWIIEKSSFYPTYGVEVPTYSLCWRNISNGAAVKIKIKQR